MDMNKLIDLAGVLHSEKLFYQEGIPTDNSL